ncbi:MAG: tyrosine-type recombinase/integrase [Pseudomonadales bacterium]
MNAFTHLVADKIEDYITLCRSLGYVFQTQSATLRAFCRFIESDDQSGPLTEDLALQFILSCDVTPTVRARRYSVLGRFAEYLSVFDAHTQHFSPRAFPPSRAITPVQILSEGELKRLLSSAQQISPRFPMRGHTLYTVLGLLASTGLRSGEARRLDRSNVDLERGLLQIRQTKFHKDRLVPVHETTRQALVDYAGKRDVAFPQPRAPAFFLNLRGGRLSSSGLYRAFHEVRTAAGFDARATRPLRPHDLRHRFAVTRLVIWHQEGIDVQSRLPLLATYLGHVRYSDTAYYVTATADLLGIAAQRAFASKEGVS